MEPSEIIALHREEQTYWWHVSRRLILKAALSRFFNRHSGKSAVRAHPACPARESYNIRSCPPAGGEARMTLQGKQRQILDVGCGTGENFKWLREFGEVTGVDTSVTAVELAKKRGQAILGRAEDLPFEDSEFNLVTAFDVLEHAADEPRALREWGRVLRSDGCLFLSVPAYPWLFGPHDRALGHYRRYALPQLQKLLRENGFQIVFGSYFFCLTFPLFWLQRTLAKKSPRDVTQYVAAPKLINILLIGLGRIEAWWLGFAKFYFGSSIVVLARKHD